MKNILTILLLSLISLNVFSQSIIIRANKKVQLSNIATLPNRIAIFGDSYTKGPPVDGGSTYPNKIPATYPSIPVINYSIGGTTVYGGSSGLAGIPGSNLIDLYHKEIDSGYHGGFVSFCFGQNDFNIVDAAWNTQYDAIIDSFLVNGWPPKRIMIIQSPCYSANDGGGRQQARVYQAAIAANRGILLENFYQVLQNTGANDSYFGFNPAAHPLNACQILWTTDYIPYLLR